MLWICSNRVEIINKHSKEGSSLFELMHKCSCYQSTQHSDLQFTVYNLSLISYDSKPNQFYLTKFFITKNVQVYKYLPRNFAWTIDSLPSWEITLTTSCFILLHLMISSWKEISLIYQNCWSSSLCELVGTVSTD